MEAKIEYPNLRAEMAKQGMKQKQLAELLDVSQPTIWRKLSGKCDWKIGEIKLICNIFNKEYYQLFK